MSKPLPWDKSGPRWSLNQPASGNMRIACSEPCAVTLADHDHHDGDGIIWNLSTVGVYVVLESLPTLGEVVTLSFLLPGEESPIRCDARVVWCNPPSIFKGCGSVAAGLPPGCGLQFIGLQGPDRRRIETRVKSTALSVG